MARRKKDDDDFDREVIDDGKSKFMTLPCILTQDEIAMKAMTCAATHEDYELKEIEKKESAAGYSSDLKALRGRMDRLAKEAREGKEFRSVQVERRANYESGYMETVRKDTGGIVKSRPLTEEERQRPLPIFTDAQVDTVRAVRQAANAKKRTRPSKVE